MKQSRSCHDSYSTNDNYNVSSCVFQDEDAKAAEADATEVATGGKEGDQNNASAEKPTTPAKDGKEKEGGRKGLLNAIRLPLVSVFPRKKKVYEQKIAATIFSLVENFFCFI